MKGWVWMKIGYACKLIGPKNCNLKSCLLKNANDEKLHELIEHNLNVLSNMIDYNIHSDINLFRISSDLIPFGSSEINKIKWWDVYADQLSAIGQKIKKSKMRVSVHPGQYTVLNSPKSDVVNRAILDLEYHNRILDSLGVDSNCKIILHIGGAYDDKEKAIRRFIDNYYLLDEKIKKRLVIENDDRSFDINDVLQISKIINAPVVFDNLHFEILPPKEEKDVIDWIKEARKTWKKQDGPQKIHYSQQDKNKKPGAHSETINTDEFIKFIKKIDFDVDIMLEVKDKNISAMKCLEVIKQL